MLMKMEDQILKESTRKNLLSIVVFSPYNYSIQAKLSLILDFSKEIAIVSNRLLLIS